MDKALVIKPIAFLYKTASNKSERIDEVLFGTKVKIINYSDDWYLVNTEYNYQGYIHKDDLSFVNYDLFELKNYIKVQVISSFVDVQEKPEIESRLIITLPKGTYLYTSNEITSDKKWTKVFYEPYSFGWLKTRTIRKSDKKSLPTEDLLRENIAKQALSYLNVPYRWGGKTHLGIDCSGLCFMSYWLNDITIYRDAKLHKDFPIKEIKRKELKKGDLIYFHGHVAMYLENNKFIHASNSNDKVQINSLNINELDYDHIHCPNILAYGSYFK